MESGFLPKNGGSSQNTRAFALLNQASKEIWVDNFHTGILYPGRMTTEPPDAMEGRSGRLHVSAERYRRSCSTCDIIAGLSANLTDLMPQVEAIYIEHLIREHDVAP
jgi:hypothetical protein